jgi:flagellar biosynthesis/type III secretory pathway M-ring protein FliF/YscJ
MPFEVLPGDDLAPAAKTSYMEMARPFAGYAVPLVAVILLVLLVLRPLVQSLSAPGGAAPALRGTITSSAGELAAQAAAIQKELPVREQVTEWARKNPQDAANVIKGWMR